MAVFLVVLLHEKNSWMCMFSFIHQQEADLRARWDLGLFVGPVSQAEEPGFILAPRVPRSVFCGLRSML